MYKNKNQLALSVIKHSVVTGSVPAVAEQDVDPKLRKKAACFVTVYVKKELRGCIGNTVPIEPLYKSIIHNAVEAISHDYRFPKTSKEELPNLAAEVSVLSPLKPYQPKNTEELLKYLTTKKPGLVLRKYGQSALFLPQVWEELPDSEEFLSQLCLKAGLAADAWRDGTTFFIFSTQ